MAPLDRPRWLIAAIVRHWDDGGHITCAGHLDRCPPMAPPHAPSARTAVLVTVAMRNDPPPFCARGPGDLHAPCESSVGLPLPCWTRRRLIVRAKGPHSRRHAMRTGRNEPLASTISGPEHHWPCTRRPRRRGRHRRRALLRRGTFPSRGAAPPPPAVLVPGQAALVLDQFRHRR